MTKPLISIIITNYNYGKYVGEAIDSIMAQTYPNIELIVINDGSTDNSDSVIRKKVNQYKEKTIRYVTRSNKGVVYTRNQGLKLAKGEYISYLDADDYFNPDYISKSYAIARKFKADVVYPNWHFVGEWLGRPDTNFPEFSTEGLQLQLLHVTPASLIRKKAIGSRRFEVEHVAEDWDFFIGMSLDGKKFKLASNNTINYRIRKGTRGSKNDPKEDTKHFVEILEKYREQYGTEKVINPQRLAKLRHPNAVQKLFAGKLPGVVIDSVRQNGVKVTTKKVLKKVASKSHLINMTIKKTRNSRYQNAIKACSVETTPSAKLAVVIHLYYPDLWDDIRDRLTRINENFDLFVSVRAEDSSIDLGKISKYHKKTNIFVLPNRGRDVLPFLVCAREIQKYDHYKYILKLHSKKSKHRTDGNEWLNSLLDELIPIKVSNVTDVLRKRNTGAVGAKSHVVSLSRYMGGNRRAVAVVMSYFTDDDKILYVLNHQDKYPFFAGTMFWCRVDLLKPILNSKLSPGDFHSEAGQVDSTTAHALERVFGRILHEYTNKTMYTVNRYGRVAELPDKSYKALYRYVE